MAERRVRVVFSAEIQGFRRAMDEAAAATRRTADAAEESSAAADTYLGRMVQSANENRDAWEKSGAALLGIGTAAVAGLALAGKAAMDWETAWAGVTKTVDGTPKQMDELEASLRGLAKTLPATHEEIAGVAEAAGQLGVKREDVVGFTKTMIDLGESTNLTADEAATSIAQISNVMGTMEREGSKGVERFGATLVALGNAGASTEAEIVDMAKRIAGAAKLVGASESDVLALANAMASVGIEAQLGGGVISRVMQRMYGDVKTGGEGLDNLAKVAGVSSKEFATAFETDPVRAVDTLVKGLGRIKDQGGNVIDTMSQLGIKGTEETSVILRLAGAGDLLSESLTLGNSAWESNSALAEEAAKRYETTESKVKIAWNNIKDAAIEAGAVLLPLIAGVAESVAGLAGWFGSLPGPVKGAMSALGGVVGVAALGAGAFLTLTPKILDTMQAFNRLAPAGGRARNALIGIGKAAGIAGAIATVALVLAKLAEADYMSKIDTGMGRINNALAEISTSGPDAKNALDQVFKNRDGGDLVETIGDLDSAINRTFKRTRFSDFNDGIESVFNGITGIEVPSKVLADSFGRIDQGLAELVAGGKADDAAKSFEKIKKSAADQGVSLEDLVKKFPQYADALKAAEAATKMAAAEGKNLDGSLTDAGKAAEEAATQAEEITKALEDVGLAADGSVTDIDKFAASLFNAGLIHLSASDASIAYQAAIDAMTESVIANGKTLDINTEQGRANRSAFNGIASSAMAAAEATATETLATEGSAAAQAQLQSALKTSYDDLILAADQLGITGDEADTMARKALGIPKNVDISAAIQDHATGTLDGIKIKADNLHGKRVDIYINTHESITKYLTEKGAADLNAAQNGGATGGRVADIMGFAGGGKVPGRAPADLRRDNMLGLVNGKPIAVQSEEWIINGRSSKEYDRELAAINAGTFPKMPGYANGGREYSARDMGYAPYRASGAPAGGVTFGDVNISQQSDPVATFHEFARRTQALTP